MTNHILSKGADPNIICQGGNTALHMAFLADNEIVSK